MPEGHTLHRIAREHRRLLVGHPVQATSPQGRFAEGARLLDGREVTGVEAYGKHLFHCFAGLGEVLHVHLGLYGRFVSGALPAPDAAGALRLRMTNDRYYVDLRGPTRCELLTAPERTVLLARLGPDPLRPRSDPAPAWRRIHASRAPIGGLLLDQSVLAGVGNVYRAEVLFHSGITPARPGRQLTEQEFDEIWERLRTMMRAGVRTGRIVTTAREHRFQRSGRVTEQDRFYVYRHAGEPCRICGSTISSTLMAARTMYWCPGCQPR